MPSETDIDRVKRQLEASGWPIRDWAVSQQRSKADAYSASLSGNPHFAMGGGVCLANALAVGVGFNMNQPLAHAYVMAGLSLTDIVTIALR